MANAEQLGSTIVPTTRRPRVVCEGVAHQLPSGDAAQVRAAAEDHDQVVVGEEPGVHVRHVVKVADVLPGLVVPFHGLEPGLSVGDGGTSIRAVVHVHDHDGDSVPDAGCTGGPRGGCSSLRDEIGLRHGLKMLGAVPCGVLTALGPEFHREVTTAAAAGRQEDGGEAEHAKGGGKDAGRGVEAVPEELASVHHRAEGRVRGSIAVRRGGGLEVVGCHDLTTCTRANPSDAPGCTCSRRA